MRAGLLYDRKATLVIAPVSGQAGRDLTGLRVAFEVKKTSASHANTATIKVWNLSETTRNMILAKKMALILRAGYGDGTLPLIASGVVQRVEHIPQPPEVMTEIEIRDGGLGLDDSKVRRAYPAGTPVSRIVEEILGTMPDVGKGSLAASSLSKTLPGKRCFSGSARHALDVLAGAYGFEWSVQDGLAQFVDRTGSTKPQATATVLSATSGLIGSPTKTNAGAKAKALLQPQINPGEFVKLESGFVSGYFKALTVEHRGDTHGEEWETEIEAKAIGKWTGIGAKSKAKK